MQMTQNVMFVGNPINAKIVCPDAATEMSYAPSGGFRGLILHSRGNFNFRLAFKTGGVAEAGGETYMLITAGNYVMFTADEASAKVFVRTENAAGDTIEVITFDSTVGMEGGVTYP